MLIRTLAGNKRRFMAILLAAFVLLQFSVSFCDVYTPLPGILASGDEGTLCEATGVFNAVTVSYNSDIGSMLSLLGKVFVTFAFLSKIAKEIFVAFSSSLSSTFFQSSDFLHCVMLRL